MIVRIPPLSMRFTATNRFLEEKHFDLVLPSIDLAPDVAKKVEARINSKDFARTLRMERYICYAVGVSRFEECMIAALDTCTVGVWLDRQVREPMYGYHFNYPLYAERLAWAKHIAKHIGIHFQSFPHNADIPKE